MSKLMTYFIKNDESEVRSEVIANKLVKKFEIKDLGKLKYFLGIEVVGSKKYIFLSRRNHVLDLLKEI